jgi:DNA-binding winged helix-turn-helix (wHTH) protein
MTKVSHLLTKETEKQLFEETILPKLLAGENLSILWTPHSGRRKAMTYLVKNAVLLGFKALGRYKMVYVDGEELTEETPQAYFRLLLGCLAKKEIAPLSADCFPLLKKKVKEIVDNGYHLVFILGRFNELNLPRTVFDNLKNIWQLDKQQIHFIFALNKNVFSSDNFDKYGQLRELLTQNLIFFPIFAEKDNQLAADSLCQKYCYRISPSQKSVAKKIAGGHPSLLKACLRILSSSAHLSAKETVDFFLKQWEIKTILQDIWNFLELEERNFLVQLALEAETNPKKIPERLLRLRLVSFGKNQKSEFFSPLFKAFVMNQKLDAPAIAIDEQTGEILVNGLPPKEKIGLQEYRLLVEFLKNPDKVISRDDIALVLWDKETDEKYSDWAIDQVISQLRTKLEKLGISSAKLQTIRNRGYRWVG